MSEQVNELERVEEELQLRRIAGTAHHIEINERTKKGRIQVRHNILKLTNVQRRGEYRYGTTY
jgi:hypothetical protein